MRKETNLTDILIEIIKIAAIIVLGFIIIKGLLQVVS